MERPTPSIQFVIDNYAGFDIAIAELLGWANDLESENARLQQELANAPRVVEAKDVTTDMEIVAAGAHRGVTWLAVKSVTRDSPRGEVYVHVENSDYGSWALHPDSPCAVRPKQSREPSNEELVASELMREAQSRDDATFNTKASRILAKLREYNRIVEGK